MNREYPGECIVPINDIGIEELDDMSIEIQKTGLFLKYQVKRWKIFS